MQGVWLCQTNISPRIHTESIVVISTYHVTYFNVLSCSHKFDMLESCWSKESGFARLIADLEYTLKTLLLFQHTMLFYTVILCYFTQSFQYIIILLYTIISIYHVTLQIYMYFNIPCHTFI